MQEVEGPLTPFEVYCYACQVTFATGTRRCVHCGGRLLGAERSRPDRELRRALGGETAAAEEEGEEEGGVFTLRRFGGLLIWTVVALSALISNLCSSA